MLTESNTVIGHNYFLEIAARRVVVYQCVDQVDREKGDPCSRFLTGVGRINLLAAVNHKS
jgi:hypothetical protein